MASKIPPQPIRPKADLDHLGTTRQEQASALLSSLLLLVGMVTGGMFLAWMSATVVWHRPIAQVNLEDAGGGSGGDNRTGEKDLVEPGTGEVRGVVSTEKVDLALESITSLVSAEAADLEGADSRDLSTRLKVGPNGPVSTIGTPAWERWEIKFSSNDINLYAQQLDFFQVELGVAGGGSDVVDYCSNFSSDMPSKRVDKPVNEKRLFFLYKSGILREADRTLAIKAGIEVTDRVVFQFYRPEMYMHLLTLEDERMRAGNHRISEVIKTTFGVRGTPGKWEFYVLDQQYRAPLPYKS